MCRKTLKIFWLCLLSIFFCVEEQAFSDSNEPIEKILTVGTSADYPPFEFIKDGEIIGFDIDLANLIAEKLGYKLQLQDMKFASIISSIQTGRIDFGISGMTITSERKKNVDFSIKYYVPKLAMVYRKESPILSVKDLNQKTIATQAGTTMESFLQEKLGSSENFKLISLHKTPSMIEELRVGRVNGVLVEEAQAKVFVKKYPTIMSYSPFESSGYGYAIVFKKGSVLKAKVDKAIKELRQSGAINKLKKKWLETSA